MPVSDAAVARAPGVRGDGCRTVACADGLTCDGRLPGGYCTSTCTGCDGECVATRDGELCAKRCTADRECRTDEGYVCDPTWHACLVPNFAAIVARECMTATPARDPAFPPVTVVSASGPALGTSPARTPVSGITLGISAVLADDGTLVTRTDARLARDRKQLYAVSIAERAIVLATSTDRGATWSTPVPVHDPADCSEESCVGRPLIAAGKNALHVLYATGDTGLRVRTSRDGGKTFTSGPLALAGSVGSVATSSDGRLHVTAMLGSPLGAYGSALQRIDYAVSRDGGATFSAPITISARDELLPYFASNPTIAVDDKRRWIYVAYARGGRDAAWDIMIAASRDGGATWKRTKLAGDGCAIHMIPNLAIDAATGTLHVAYYDSAGARGRFAHASCGPGVTKCKLHGAINSTRFAGLSLTRHTPTWLGDFESLVVDDKRRQLHAVWAQSVEEGSGPVMRVFHAVAKLKK
jgi:photosystem II stability/assembly factor-like uncharacterized protein